jgi:hypothetical protein
LRIRPGGTVVPSGGAGRYRDDRPAGIVERHELGNAEARGTVADQPACLEQPGEMIGDETDAPVRIAIGEQLAFGDVEDMRKLDGRAGPFEPGSEQGAAAGDLDAVGVGFGQGLRLPFVDDGELFPGGLVVADRQQVLGQRAADAHRPNRIGIAELGERFAPHIERFGLLATAGQEIGEVVAEGGEGFVVAGERVFADGDRAAGMGLGLGGATQQAEAAREIVVGHGKPRIVRTGALLLQRRDPPQDVDGFGPAVLRGQDEHPVVDSDDRDRMILGEDAGRHRHRFARISLAGFQLAGLERDHRHGGDHRHRIGVFRRLHPVREIEGFGFQPLGGVEIAARIIDDREGVDRVRFLGAALGRDRMPLRHGILERRLRFVEPIEAGQGRAEQRRAMRLVAWGDAGRVPCLDQDRYGVLDLRRPDQGGAEITEDVGAPRTRLGRGRERGPPGSDRTARIGGNVDLFGHRDRIGPRRLNGGRRKHEGGQCGRRMNINPQRYFPREASHSHRR